MISSPTGSHFPASEPHAAAVRALPDGGALTYFEAFLDAAEATSFHERLVQELVWEQRAIVLFGKEVQQPRLIAWGGDVAYRYSGQTLELRPLTPSVRELIRRVNAAFGVAFNHVLVNRYRDEKDSMGLHSDDEPELGVEPVIATLSLGAVRRFVLVPRRKGSERFSYELGHGSLLVMSGPCQARYRHGIPKETRSIGERVSLTFRRIV